MKFNSFVFQMALGPQLPHGAMLLGSKVEAPLQTEMRISSSFGSKTQSLKKPNRKTTKFTTLECQWGNRMEQFPFQRKTSVAVFFSRNFASFSNFPALIRHSGKENLRFKSCSYPKTCHRRIL